MMNRGEEIETKKGTKGGGSLSFLFRLITLI